MAANSAAVFLLVPIEDSINELEMVELIRSEGFPKKEVAEGAASLRQDLRLDLTWSGLDWSCLDS